MTKVYTKKSEDTWNAIAHSFDSTRRKTWKECIDFIDSLPKTSIVADVGSGNGRHLIPCAKHCKKVIGLDVSGELLKITQEKLMENKLVNVDLVHSDAVNIPLNENSVDAVLFIAALHNVPQRYRRIKALKEINRILKPNGKAIISVWSRWQDKFRQHFLRKCLTKVDKNEFGDIDVYWRQHGLNIPRFYHLYSKRELKQDLEQAGFEILELEGTKYFSKKFNDNYFAIIKK
ncbi:MAG: methyltransferase domain-containing protein [Thermoplasmatales archaeon]|nr:methyltransferase domain-containing protein [Thermoplasmatales archaeon]